MSGSDRPADLSPRAPARHVSDPERLEAALHLESAAAAPQTTAFRRSLSSGGDAQVDVALAAAPRAAAALVADQALPLNPALTTALTLFEQAMTLRPESAALLGAPSLLGLEAGHVGDSGVGGSAADRGTADVAWMVTALTAAELANGDGRLTQLLKQRGGVKTLMSAASAEDEATRQTALLVLAALAALPEQPAATDRGALLSASAAAAAGPPEQQVRSALARPSEAASGLVGVSHVLGDDACELVSQTTPLLHGASPTTATLALDLLGKLPAPCADGDAVTALSFARGVAAALEQSGNAHAALNLLAPGLSGAQPVSARQPRSVACKAAEVVLQFAARNDACLLQFVNAGAVPRLTALLLRGARHEASAAAAALAALARHPSSHEVMFACRACDALIKCARSRDPVLFDAQVGIARALELLCANPASQFGLIGRGLAPAIATLLERAHPDALPATANMVLYLCHEGHSQGDVLVHADVVRPLVAVMRGAAGSAHRHAAQQALHALLLRAGAGAAVAAVRARAAPVLVAMLSDSDQVPRQRAARLLGLLLHAVPEMLPGFVKAQSHEALVAALWRPGQSLPERAELIDALYLLRRQPEALAALAAPGVVRVLAGVLDACVPNGAGPAAASAGTDGVDWGAQAPGTRLAAQAGLFSDLTSLGGALQRDATAGKVVRLLAAMARNGAAAPALAQCPHLAVPLARCVATADAAAREGCGPGPMSRFPPIPPLPAAGAGEWDDEGVPRPVIDAGAVRLADQYIMSQPWDAIVSSVDRERSLYIYTTTTHQAAQQLVNWLIAGRQAAAGEVLHELVAQLWLGGNDSSDWLGVDVRVDDGSA